MATDLKSAKVLITYPPSPACWLCSEQRKPVADRCKRLKMGRQKTKTITAKKNGEKKKKKKIVSTAVIVTYQEKRTYTTNNRIFLPYYYYLFVILEAFVQPICVRPTLVTTANCLAHESNVDFLAEYTTDVWHVELALSCHSFTFHFQNRSGRKGIRIGEGRNNQYSTSSKHVCFVYTTQIATEKNPTEE